MTLIAVGLLGIKEFKPTPVLIPALIITIIFHYVVLSMFTRPWEFVSLHDAANCDIADRTPLLRDEEADDPTLEKDAYKSPMMKIKKGDADELLRMATAVLARIEQGNVKSAESTAPVSAPPAPAVAAATSAIKDIAPASAPAAVATPVSPSPAVAPTDEVVEEAAELEEDQVKGTEKV